MATVVEQSAPLMQTVSEAALTDTAAMSQLQQNGDKLAAAEEADMPQKKYGDIIVVKRSGRDGSRFPILSNTNITIGRSENCNIRVVLETVSEEHVMISIDEGKKLVVKNLAKMGGSTFLNKVLMLPNETTGLYAGDVIGVCDREFRIELTSTEKTPGKSRALAPRKERAFSTATKSPGHIRKMSGTKRSFSSSPSRVLAVIGGASQSPARMTVRSPGRAMAHSSTKAARPPPSKIPTKQRSASMQQPFRLGLPRPNIDPFASPSLQESFKKWKAESPRKSVQSTPKEASDQQSCLIDMDKEVSPMTGQSRQSVRIRNLLDATLTPAGLGQSSRLSLIEKTSSPVGEKTPIRAEIVDTIPETSEYDSDHAVDDTMGTELDDQVFAEDGEEGQPRQSVRIRNLLDATLTPAGLGHSSRLSVIEKTASSPVGERTPVRAEIAEHDSDQAVDDNSECVPPTPTSSLPPFSTAAVAVQVAEVIAIDSKAVSGSPGHAGAEPSPSVAPGRRRSSRLSTSKESSETSVFEVTPVRTEAASMITGEENERDLPELHNTSDYVPATPTMALPPISTVAVPSPAVGKDEEKAASVTPGPGSSKKPNRRSSRLTSPKETSDCDVNEPTLEETEAANQLTTRNEEEHSLPQLDETNDFVPSTPTMLLPPFSAVALPSVVNEKDNEKEVGVSPSLADAPLIPARRSNRLLTPKDTNNIDVNEETLVEQKKKTPNKKTPLLSRPSSSRRSAARKESPKELMNKSPHVVVQSTPKVASDHQDQDQDHLIDMDKEVSPLTGQPRQSVQIRNLLDATLTPAGFGRNSRLSVVEKTANSPVGEKTPIRAEKVDTIPETSEHDSDQVVDDNMGTEVDEQTIAAEDGEDGSQVSQLDETKERMPLTPTVAAPSPVSTVAVPSAENAKDEERDISVSPARAGTSQTPSRRSSRLHSPKATSNTDEQTKKTPTAPSPLPGRRSNVDEQTKKTPTAPSPLVDRRSSTDEQTKKTPTTPSPLVDRRSNIDEQTKKTPTAPSPLSVRRSNIDEQTKKTPNIPSPLVDRRSSTDEQTKKTPNTPSPRVVRRGSTDEQTKKTPTTPSPLPARRSSSKRSSVLDAAHPASPGNVHEEDEEQHEVLAHNSSQPSFTPPKSPRVPVKSVLRLARVAASDSDSSIDSKRKVVFTPEPAVKFIPRIGTKSVRETERLENEEKKAAAKRAADALEAQWAEEAETLSPVKKSAAAAAAQSPDVAKEAPTTETIASARRTSMRNKSATTAPKSPEKKPAKTTSRKKNTTEDTMPPSPSLQTTAVDEAKTPATKATKKKTATSAVSAKTVKKTAEKAKPASRRAAAQKTDAVAVVDDHSPPAATKGAATRRNKQNMQPAVLDKEEHDASPPKRSRRSAKKEVSEAVEAEPAAPSTAKPRAKKTVDKEAKKTTRKAATKTEEATPPPVKKMPAGRRAKQSSQTDAEDESSPPKRGRPSGKKANAVEAEAVATKTSKKAVAKKTASKKVAVEAPPQAETVVKRVTKRTKQPAEVTVEPPTEQAEAVATKTSKKTVAKKGASKKVTVETPPPAETVVKRVTKRGKQPTEVTVEPPTKSVRGRKAAAAAQV